ncbi:MAG: helix-hairpin-helix domain-containing protein [Bryobacteraceae bacterium]
MTERNTRSVSTWSTEMRVVALAAISAAGLLAQLPEGPGRAETEKLCKNCHELQRSISRRQDKEGWQATIKKMIAFGTKGTDEEFMAVIDYLAKHYPAEDVPPVNANESPAIEFESRLGLKRSQAAAIVAYRTKNGKFKTIEDLKKVPGIDIEKIDAKRDRIVF